MHTDYRRPKRTYATAFEAVRALHFFKLRCRVARGNRFSELKNDLVFSTVHWSLSLMVRVVGVVMVRPEASVKVGMPS